MDNDSTLVAATAAIIGLGAYVVALLGFIKAYAWAGKSLEGVARGVQNGMSRVASTAGKAGKKAAMNSKYGQAAQQFMGNRKSIAALKGREALRGTLEKNPNLMKLMGGAGGGKYAARYLDAEQRKHDSEQVANLKQGLTPAVANALASRTDPNPAKREDIAGALRAGKWSSGRKIEDVDRVALTKLQNEGYMDQNYNVKGDSYLARASLGSIMDAEMAEPDNIRQLASMVGTDTRQNALFTEMLQGEAQKHGYKNLQYASVSNGQWDPNQQYFIKESGDPKKGARKVVQSGLSGVNKDALDPTMDTSLLEAVHEEYKDAAKNGRGDAFIRKIAEQTKHIDKDSIVKAIADQMPSVTLTEFQDLRSSIKSGGAVAAPARFAGAGAPAPTPAPQQTQTAPPPPGYQQAPGSPLIVPHSPAPTPRPRPGGNFNGPNPPANP